MISAASRPPVSDSAVARVAPRARSGVDDGRGARLGRIGAAHAATVPRMALPIEDYALIGDRHTAALVGKNGSIDWLCLPRFDSPACFAGLLGTDEPRPLAARARRASTTSTRRYVDDSAALETTFTTADGVVTLLDVMPTGDNRADVVRRVTGVSGTRADAARVGGAHRLRADRPVGAPPRDPRRGGDHRRRPVRTSWCCAGPGCRSATSTGTTTSSTSRPATS